MKEEVEEGAYDGFSGGQGAAVSGRIMGRRRWGVYKEEGEGDGVK